jgi:hypothetical protein
MPVTRPLRIYTLDPSVSDRVGGVATVEIPYEKLEPGPTRSMTLSSPRAFCRASLSWPSTTTAATTKSAHAKTNESCEKEAVAKKLYGKAHDDYVKECHEGKKH